MSVTCGLQGHGYVEGQESGQTALLLSNVGSGTEVRVTDEDVFELLSGEFVELTFFSNDGLIAAEGHVDHISELGLVLTPKGGYSYVVGLDDIKFVKIIPTNDRQP